MENHPVYRYYKNYIKINDRQFLWDDISVSSGKRIVVNNINGIDRPVLQFLGSNETHFNITIRYGGIYKAPQTSTNIEILPDGNLSVATVSETKNLSAEDELKKTFLEQKQFIENIINNRAKTVKIEFPDGDIAYGALLNRTKSYQKLGINVEQLEFIMLTPSVIFSEKPDSTEISSIKVSILQTLKSELTTGGVPTGFMQKIKNSKLASWLSKANQSISKLYKNFRKYANLVKNYITKVQNILTKVQDICTTVVSAAQEPLKMFQMLEDINKQLVDIAKTPGRIVDIFEQICQATKTYLNNTKNAFKMLFQMFDFSKSNNDKLVEYYNIRKLQEDIMENEIRETNNIVTFANILTTATEIEFDTDEEIQQYLLQIDEMYNFLMEDESISNEIKDLLYDGFNKLKAYLLNNATAARNIKYIDIKTPKTLHKIVYEYYGSEELYDDILALNKNIIDDVLSVKGQIKVYDL